MTHLIGIDVGGTKIAGGVFAPDGQLLHESIIPTLQEYDAFIDSISSLIKKLMKNKGEACSVGVGLPGTIDHEFGIVDMCNVKCSGDHSVRDDIENQIGQSIKLANDANCSALAEALDGAGQGSHIVLGLIMGTGVGSGLIVNGQIVDGPNGYTGEIGHLSLPNHDPKTDGPLRKCGCGQFGCIESAIQGAALSSLYEEMCAEKIDPPIIADRARAGDKDALRVLDCYYEIVAKAMRVPIYAYDPDVIVVSGGLNSLPGLYEEVPKRWGKYCAADRIKTKFVPAKHGPMAGMRGAAYLWKD